MPAKAVTRELPASRRIPEKLTTKQFGDACEHLVLAHLLLADQIAHKMPDGWPGYDLTVSQEHRDVHVSVKARRLGKDHKAWTWTFRPDEEERRKADWIAFVLINVDDRSDRRIYIVPFKWAMANSRYQKTTGNQRMDIRNPELERFRDNFALNGNPPGHREYAQARAIVRAP
jgi:hypothetical protein